MPIRKRQHYVPKFYLKSFGNTTIYYYDKWKDQTIKTTVDNIAVGKAFNQLDGDKEGIIEQFLSRKETQFSQAYYELIDKKDVDKLSQKTKGDLYLFIASQFLRTEQARFDLKDTTSQALTKFVEMSGIKIPKGVVVTYDEKSIKAMHLNMIIKDTPEIASYFGIKKWIVQENDSNIPLWTSDHPITMQNTVGGDIGIMCKGIEIRFPLTSKLNLLSFDNSTHRIVGDSRKLEEGNVIYDNMIQLRLASRFVYTSSDNDFERARWFIKDNPEFKSPYRRRTQVYRLKRNKDGSGYTVV